MEAASPQYPALFNQSNPFQHETPPSPSPEPPLVTPIHIQTPHGKPAEKSSPPPEKEMVRSEVEPASEPEEKKKKEDHLDSVLMEGVAAGKKRDV